MQNVHFMFFDAGGGHRSAATALRDVAGSQGRPWRIQLVNLQETLDSLDIFRKMTGVRFEDIYNNMLAKGWTLGSQYLLPPMHGIIRLYHPAQVRALAEFWRKNIPDLVVSVVPNFNRAMYQALRQAAPDVPFITILTDFADYPPHFWIERGQDQYIIAGTERAAEQARHMDYGADRVFLVSGMILRPAFYRESCPDRRAERARLGLHPDKVTGLVLFGGQGSAQMLRIAQRLQESANPPQLILLCGRNEKLAKALRRTKARAPMHIEGFTSEVPYFMSLADFFVGKPGPGSISEAMAMHLPVIIERNAWTLPQERYNADWVREKEVGLVVHSFNDIRSAVETLLDPATLTRFRRNTAAVRNRAVFEIPDILDKIMAGGGRTGHAV